LPENWADNPRAPNFLVAVTVFRLRGKTILSMEKLEENFMAGEQKKPAG